MQTKTRSPHLIPAFLPPTPLLLPKNRTINRPLRIRLPPTSLLSRSKVPLILTYTRLATIPLLFLTHPPPPFPSHPTLSATLFALSSLTDFLDGHLARRWHAETSLGAFLDPVADKLLVSVSLTLILARGLSVPSGLGFVAAIATALVLAREVFVSALREWMAACGRAAVVKVSVWGKVKTAMQMVALTALLFAERRLPAVAAVGVFALAVSAVLSVLSAAEYSIAAVRALGGLET